MNPWLAFGIGFVLGLIVMFCLFALAWAGGADARARGEK